MILNKTYANSKLLTFFFFFFFFFLKNYFHATKVRLYTTLKAWSWQSPLYQPPHLHLTSGDEAFVLDVTHLEELTGFLQDSVVSHIPTLTCTLFAAPLPLPYSSGHCAAHSIGSGTRKRKSCHGFC